VYSECTVHIAQLGLLIGVALEAQDMLEFAAQLDANGGLKITIPRAVVRTLASKACRSTLFYDNIYPANTELGAIMFGDQLSKEESKSLLNKLKQCKNPFACAHGRPTVVPLAQLPSQTSRK
jgi:DNA mismatch repair ATPase MutL